MSQFRVTIMSRKRMPVVTQDGFFGNQVEFRLQRLSDRHTYNYVGNGGGKQFERRCQLLLAAGGVLVELPDSETVPPDTSWKEKVVNCALEDAERLQQSAL